MAAIAPGAGVQRPAGRAVLIEVVDRQGRPAGGAEIAVNLGSRFAGTISTGSGVERPMTLVVDNPQAVIELKVSLLGQVQRILLPPGQGSVKFVFASAPYFAASIQPVLTCPDGTVGYPCVTCRDGGAIWKMCA